MRLKLANVIAPCQAVDDDPVTGTRVCSRDAVWVVKPEGFFVCDAHVEEEETCVRDLV